MNAVADSREILVLGDSLSTAHGFDPGLGWVQLLQRRLRTNSYPYTIINRSLTGETSSGALARLPAILKAHNPDIIIIELGGNDGLRGLGLAQTRSNLKQLIHLCHQAASRVILLEMKLPPNYGKTFTQRFSAIYHELATLPAVNLVPFFLDGVADRPDRMQKDGIHPNAEGQPQMLENLWPHLEPLLRVEPARTG